MSRKSAGTFLGVDVGGTWLRAALRSPSGLRRARRRVSPSIPIDSMLRGLLARWGLRRCDRLVLGSTGVWLPRHKRALARRLRGLAREVRVLSDVELAWEACLGGRPGILVIAGTGSIAFARDARGKTKRAGGLGPLLGDAGSAFWIGRRWLERRPEAQALALAHRPGVVRSVAALAPAVLRRSRRDPRARAILNEAARELARLAIRLSRGLSFPDPVRVSWWGGVFENAALRSSFLRALRRSGKKFIPLAPRSRPEDAATSL